MFKLLVVICIALCSVATSSPVPPDVDIDHQGPSGPQTKESFFLPKLPLPKLSFDKLPKEFPIKFPSGSEVAEKFPKIANVLKDLFKGMGKKPDFLKGTELFKGPEVPKGPLSKGPELGLGPIPKLPELPKGPGFEIGGLFPKGPKPAKGPEFELGPIPKLPKFPKGPEPGFPERPEPGFPKGPEPGFPKGPEPGFPKGPELEFHRGFEPEFPRGPEPEFPKGPEAFLVPEKPVIEGIQYLRTSE